MSTLPIHAHLATEFNNRLTLLRHEPQTIFIYGADAGHSHQYLNTRYPKAQITEYDARSDWLALSNQAQKSHWLDKLKGKKIKQIQQPWRTMLPEAQAQMLWSNLALWQNNDLLDTFKNWAQALKTDGTLFFSHLGRDSLPEIRQLLAQHNISCAAPTLIDMHDLADMLQDNGFYDPVTDTSQLQLTYQHNTTLLQDITELSIWQALQPNDATAAQRIVEQALYSGSLKTLTLEIVFGHAIKKLMLPENEHLVQFHHKSINQTQ